MDGLLMLRVFIDEWPSCFVMDDVTFWRAVHNSAIYHVRKLHIELGMIQSDRSTDPWATDHFSNHGCLIMCLAILRNVYITLAWPLFDDGTCAVVSEQKRTGREVLNRRDVEHFLLPTDAHNVKKT